MISTQAWKRDLENVSFLLFISSLSFSLSFFYIPLFSLFRFLYLFPVTFPFDVSPFPSSSSSHPSFNLCFYTGVCERIQRLSRWWNECLSGKEESWRRLRTCSLSPAVVIGFQVNCGTQAVIEKILFVSVPRSIRIDVSMGVSILLPRGTNRLDCTPFDPSSFDLFSYWFSNSDLHNKRGGDPCLERGMGSATRLKSRNHVNWKACSCF